MRKPSTEVVWPCSAYPDVKMIGGPLATMVWVTNEFDIGRLRRQSRAAADPTVWPLECRVLDGGLGCWH